MRRYRNPKFYRILASQARKDTEKQNQRIAENQKREKEEFDALPQEEQTRRLRVNFVISTLIKIVYVILGGLFLFGVLSELWQYFCAAIVFAVVFVPLITVSKSILKIWQKNERIILISLQLLVCIVAITSCVLFVILFYITEIKETQTKEYFPLLNSLIISSLIWILGEVLIYLHSQFIKGKQS